MRRRVRKMSGLSLKGVVLTICIILLLGVSGVAFYLFKNARDKAEESYRNRISELEETIDKNTKAVYRSKEYIPAGTAINSQMLEKTEILSVLTDYADETDMGSYLAVDIQPGCEITRNLLKPKDSDSVPREAEFDLSRIPETVNEGDFVDIRIRFPDGTDYIVVSKKKLIHIDNSGKRASFHLSEEELLLMDSASIDSYIYDGAEVYLTKYVSPSSDTASVVNYLPSEALEKLIRNNPNILNISSENMSTAGRKLLENLLNDFMSEESGKHIRRNDDTEEEKDQKNGGSIWD